MELLIEIDSLWEFPEGVHRFCSERPNDVLLFQKERTAADKFVTRDEFVSLHGRGKVSRSTSSKPERLQANRFNPPTSMTSLVRTRKVLRRSCVLRLFNSMYADGMRMARSDWAAEPLLSSFTDGDLKPYSGDICTT